ncbi:WSSV303 [White spot syndrome virus]|uniref:WSSV303 n=1 Tax=White spot syndrome virus TaxID=342409 RepID=A0A2I6SC19_9VIRU|nr:WSSV303 [White spot syndrome virus]
MDSNTSILPPSKRPGLNLLQVLGIIITVALIASVSSFIFYRVGKRKYYPSSSSSSELSDVDNGVEGGGGTTTTPTQPSPDGGDGYVDLSPQKKAELRTRVANVIFQEVSKDQGVAFRRAMNDSTDKIMEETEARINNFSEPFREATVEREVFKDDTDKNFILSTLDLTEEQFKDIVMAEVKNQLENFDYEDMSCLIFDNIQRLIIYGQLISIRKI